MAQLPRFDPAEVTTKSDLGELGAATKSDLAALRTDMAALRAATKSDNAELRDGLASVNQRLDRFFVALLVGMFGVVVALVFTVD